LRILVKQRQQRFGKPGKVPLGDLRLPAVGVAAVVIDGTEDGIRIVGVHERAGAVIDGFTAKGHVVRVHDAVDEANQQPAGHQGRLPLHDGPAAGQDRDSRCGQIGKVAADGVVGQRPDPSGLPLAAAYSKVPTRMWLAAVRVRIAPCRVVSRNTGSPVVTTARLRVVGMPRACRASLMMYSRSIGPRAARPSPCAKTGSCRTLELDVEALALGVTCSPSNNGPPIAQHGERPN
jgi:hypothetical protein